MKLTSVKVLILYYEVLAIFFLFHPAESCFLGKQIDNYNQILQNQFPKNTKFFCDTSHGCRSKKVPKTVHELTPGDIDVVGAIGDSGTIAFGALARNVFEMLTPSRGVSASIGGEDSWQNYLTIPNILKLYNPKIRGYSKNHVLANDFNTAVFGVYSSDSARQAAELVSRMKNDQNVDIQNDWKLITYLIGTNDFCLNVCNEANENVTLQNAANDLLKTLRILRDNLPRTLVNVVLPPNVDSIAQIKNKPVYCTLLQIFLCPCFADPIRAHTKSRTLNILRLWKEQMERIVKLPEFHNSNIFEVNIHRFLDQATIPQLQNGDADMSYLSKDCSHFSQKGHAFLANGLWNSMLTPENQRLRFLKKEFEEIKCPQPEKPYLATIKNS